MDKVSIGEKIRASRQYVIGRLRTSKMNIYYESRSQGFKS